MVIIASSLLPALSETILGDGGLHKGVEKGAGNQKGSCLVLEATLAKISHDFTKSQATPHSLTSKFSAVKMTNKLNSPEPHVKSL